MDIAKYVGLFLIKNEYCFLPGIGSLQVIKKKAAYNKESEQLNGPTYDVVFDQRYGSIDDSFANFIANNERISIAHAANHLKDFCAESKLELKEGKEIIIPAIGKFTGGANATIQFVAEPNLNIQGRSIPYFKNSTSTEVKREEPITQIIENTSFREPKGDEEIVLKAPQVNWGKIIMLAAIVLIVVAGGIFLFWYMNNSKGDKAATPAVTEEQTVQPAADTTAAEVPAQETTVPATTPATTANADGTITYNVALHQYPTRERAEGRVAKLKSYGNSTVSMIARDSATYYVAISVSSNPSDTTKVVDSLKKLFNPGGKVEILK
jgi:nucleoid DNA-binding protein